MISLSCPHLPEFDARNWDAIAATFAAVPAAALGQHWHAAPQAGFMPANARFGWRDSTLFLYVTMRDVDIFNTTDGPNQETWMQGDTLELFLRPLPGETYFELHVTPDDHHLQLRLPDANAITSGRDWREFHVTEPLFRTLIEVDADQETWRVLMAVDLPALQATEIPPSQPWKFSVSRYDWTRGEAKPIISSTSPHEVPNFHRQHEWGELVFAR